MAAWTDTICCTQREPICFAAWDRSKRRLRATGKRWHWSATRRSGGSSNADYTKSNRLHFASEIVTVISLSGESKRRSGCPVSISLEILGDRWSLLIIRDLMVRGLRRFREFQQSGEGIATNILADRLQKLEAAGIITVEVDDADARCMNYRLTEKGIDLAPVLLELLDLGRAPREHGRAVRRHRRNGTGP